MSDIIIENNGENELLITFILFTYNQEQFIREAVESVLAQTYSPMEIIFSDDNSTDRTFDIMQEVSAEYSGNNEIIIRNNTSNLGLENHINTVWTLAKGQWIVVAAGDDVSEENRVSEIVKVIKQHPDVTGISSDLTVINSESIAMGNTDEKNTNNEVITLWGIDELMNERVPLAHGATAAYSKKLLTDFVPLPDDSVYEDAILSFRSVLIGKQAHIYKNLVKYRSHENQTTNIVTINNNENDKKRIRNFYGSYLSTLQYLDDYHHVFGYDNNDNIKAWISKKIHFTEYRYKSISWIWPFRIMPYVVLKFYDATEDSLSRDSKAKILLPDSIYRIIKGIMS